MAKIGKELLGTLSPVYGMATGHGMFGNAVGLLPALAKDMRDDKEKEKAEAAAAAAGVPPQPGMKKGGKVKKMKSGGYVRAADGIAQRGKTKGKFV